MSQTPARVPEQLVIEHLPDETFRSVLCTTLGRAQLAEDCAEWYPAARVQCHFLDIYQADAARLAIAPWPRNLSLVCEADFPAGPFDLVALPFDSKGVAELTRDLLQEGHESLTIGGTLICAVDHPDEQWLHGEMRKLFAKVTRRPVEQGVIYLAKKTAPLKKRKNFTAEFAMRDGERLLKLVSRPGVFAHRRPDSGARALLKAVAAKPTDHVFEIGCGSGAVALAIAARVPEGRVYAVDSNARAVECTRRGAELNGLTNVRTALTADAKCDVPGSFDLVVANPPYYSHYRISEVFVQGAIAALKPEGSLQMVTKSTGWYEERLALSFREVFVEPGKEYSVVTGVGLKEA